eukprot:Clim_evm17s234 gene=Clim_evmTU17s234
MSANLALAAALGLGVGFVVGRQSTTPGFSAVLEPLGLGDQSYAAWDDDMVKYVSSFHITSRELRMLKDRMIDAFHAGLRGDKNAVLPMLPSYVKHFPTGNEHGDFLALDLGGSNFRVLNLHIDEDGEPSMTAKKYHIDNDLKTGQAAALFDFLADCIEDFHPECKTSKESVPLGFTFSFPVEQQGLAKGVLKSWTKGFSASGVLGQDVVQLLQEACERKKLHVKVVAICNDTVGTQVARMIDDRRCYVGIIVGTGSNACYWERMSNIGKIEGNEGHMIVNTEWGFYDGVPSTTIDDELDADTHNKGKSRFEKMISGMYLGEIFRRVVLRANKDGKMFKDNSLSSIKDTWSIDTAVLSQMEADETKTLSDVKTVLQRHLNVPHVSTEDAYKSLRIAQAISNRAANLAAMATAALVEKANRTNDCTVAFDGTVMLKYPHFEERMKSALSEILPRGHNITFKKSEDGSGRGAAIIAATALQGE